MGRNYYSVLGVAPDASDDDIREAYFARMRVVHPDKHRKQDPKAWATANELAAELNEAYNELRDASRRAAYDATFGRTATASATASRQQPNQSQQRETTPDGELTAGRAKWRDLPTTALASLLKRQDDKIQEQVRVPMGGVGGNYFWVVVLLGWFSYLAYATGQPTWSDELYYSYAAGSALAALLIGVNVSAIRRYYISPLKNNLYVTPLYFIETTPQEVAFWPLWSVKKVGATHHHQNGSHKHTVLDVQFESETRQWTFRSMKKFENFYKQLAVFDAAARQNILYGNTTYFEMHDDFRGFDRSTGSNDKGVSRSISLPGLLAVAGIMLFLYADSVNQSRAAERWFYHANGAPRSLAELWESVSSGTIATGAGLVSNPSDYSSFTGTIIENPDPSLIAPRQQAATTSNGQQHGLQPPRRMPREEFRAEFGREPVLEQIEPPTLLEDDLLRADGLEKIGAQASSRVAPPVPPQPMPENGTVKRYHQAEAIAPLEIVTRGSEGYFVKMVHAGTDNVAATIFIRSGMTVQFDMPLGSYEMRYAAGTKWYGENFLFGEETSYARADTTFNFAVFGNRVEGYTVELFLQENGNMETESIRPEDF